MSFQKFVKWYYSWETQRPLVIGGIIAAVIIAVLMWYYMTSV